MIGYKIGNEILFNKYLALYESFSKKQSINFVCREQQFDAFDWTVEPPQSLDDLMTANALHLRQKYERLILGWSGGTDSHTIYNIFKKNKIHIDEIIIKTSPHLAYQPKYAATWLRKNHYSSDTIISEYDNHDDYYRMIDRPNEEWIWKNSGDIMHSGVNTNGAHTKAFVEKNHSGKNYVYICGLAEPWLLYKNNSYHSCVCDRVMNGVMGHNHEFNIEYFFLDPLLLIKQSHLLKKYIKNIVANSEHTKDPNKVLKMHQETSIDSTHYYNYKKAIGRHDELSHGVSWTQKVAYLSMMNLDLMTQKTYKIILDTKDIVLKETLSAENKASYIYAKGLFNLSTERKFINFLIDKNYTKNQKTLLRLRPMYSKFYYLGT